MPVTLVEVGKISRTICRSAGDKVPLSINGASIVMLENPRPEPQTTSVAAATAVGTGDLVILIQA